MVNINSKENIKNEYLPIFKLGLTIDKVLLDKSSKVLSIKLLGEKLLLRDDLNMVREFFQKEFQELELELKISYNLDASPGDKINFYQARLKELISEEIESSNSWIDNLKIDFQNQELNIYSPNLVAHEMMIRNGLKQNIERAIQEELGLGLAVKILDSGIEKAEDFLEKAFEEEKNIASKAMAEAPRKLEKAKDSEEGRVSSNYSYGKEVNKPVLSIKDIDIQSGSVAVEGFIFNREVIDIRNNKKLVVFNITDLKDSIECKVFLKEKDAPDFLANVDEDSHCILMGDVVYDDFSRSIVVMIKSLRLTPAPKREDLSSEKRVELHLHTKMSSMDGIVNVKKLIKTAEAWGHKAIAITDHGVVQAYPEALDVSRGSDLKLIYGMEGYMVNDTKEVLSNYKTSAREYIVFDIETTGLSNKNDRITEIGALKIDGDGRVIDEFSQLVNPEKKIPEFIVNLTGITDEMVKDKPKISQVIKEFYDFIGDAILIAHNATFDIGFIRENMSKEGLEIDNPVLDTLELARASFPNLKNHKLNTLAKYLSVSLENHHRAVDDAKATADIFLKILEINSINNISEIAAVNTIDSGQASVKDRPYHMVILAQNLVGLKNLYKLVSKSHMEYFYRQPRIPKSILEEYREGLLISSACSSGELYQAILNNKSEDEINKIAKFYDYFEVQPIANNDYLLREGIMDQDQLEDINRKIIELGRKHNKIVVATGDVHFLNPEDEVYRRILMAGQGFRDAEFQPPLYLKTTEEMLKDFDYLGEDLARELVIENTNKIADSIEKIQPIPDGTFPPIIEGSEEELKKISFEKAHELYGDPLPKIVEDRLNIELSSIIKNGYSVMYIIAQKLVWKSLEDGYLVGSRGSVGSSLVATMSGITEINPLAPHYLCPKCKYSEFFSAGEIASGADLKDKDCPNCKTELIKDGHDIPFEVFLGFDGDKEPDIDLNFAGEYQSNAHKYTEELFGQDYVFRAGTIGTIADRTAYGFVKKYFEGIGESVGNPEINRLVKGCAGVKRTSGQHPGGVMIVPHYKDIHDFSPIQYPANDPKSGVITTHFDYNAISSNILKLDILGHDVPTIIRMLEDMTGVDPQTIALDEENTMSLFASTEALKVSPEEINSKVGTLGIPEFGTKFVRQMLVDTKPTTFSELVRISGLSHGTDVWINNAQELVRNNIAPLSKVISTREDIMLGLINVGMDKSKAFNIMEKVRKGKGLPPGAEEEMKELGVEDWYIDSCKKIKYMFPKAHAAAYVMMSFRIAYFKVFYPEAFYATYFTTKAADFDADLIIRGLDHIKASIKDIEMKGFDATTKEKNLLTVLEVALEMYARGYKIDRVDLYKSDSDVFKLGDNGLLPPLKCLDGLGGNAAKNIVVEREKSKFISKEDLIKRAGVSRPTIEVLTNHGCLDDLPDSNQMNLFNL